MSPNARIVITGIFTLVIAVYLMRLFFLQVIDDKYKLSASNNVLRYITEYPARGCVQASAIATNITGSRKASQDVDEDWIKAIPVYHADRRGRRVSKRQHPDCNRTNHKTSFVLCEVKTVPVIATTGSRLAPIGVQ